MQISTCTSLVESTLLRYSRDMCKGRQLANYHPLPSPQNKNTNMRLERYKGKQQFTCMYIGPLKCGKKDNLNTVEVK